MVLQSSEGDSIIELIFFLTSASWNGQFKDFLYQLISRVITLNQKCIAFILTPMGVFINFIEGRRHISYFHSIMHRNIPQPTINIFVPVGSTNLFQLGHFLQKQKSKSNGIPKPSRHMTPEHIWSSTSKHFSNKCIPQPEKLQRASFAYLCEK